MGYAIVGVNKINSVAGLNAASAHNQRQVNNLPLFLTTHKSQTNPKGIPKCFAILGYIQRKDW